VRRNGTAQPAQVRAAARDEEEVVGFVGGRGMAPWFDAADHDDGVDQGPRHLKKRPRLSPKNEEEGRPDLWLLDRSRGTCQEFDDDDESSNICQAAPEGRAQDWHKRQLDVLHRFDPSHHHFYHHQPPADGTVVLSRPGASDLTAPSAMPPPVATAATAAALWSDDPPGEAAGCGSSRRVSEDGSSVGGVASSDREGAAGGCVEPDSVDATRALEQQPWEDQGAVVVAVPPVPLEERFDDANNNDMIGGVAAAAADEQGFPREVVDDDDLVFDDVDAAWAAAFWKEVLGL
jgi:hypothetical protein